MSDYIPYKDHRDQIQSGDLLIWNAHGKLNLNDYFLYLVRFLTASDFNHVAIAIRESDKLYIVEAVIPKVQKIELSTKEEFFHIPMNIKWKKKYTDFLMAQVGKDYSIKDCIRAFLGSTTETDDEWQCAELANKFYKLAGLDFENAYTPDKLVNAILETIDTSIYKIKNL